MKPLTTPQADARKSSSHVLGLLIVLCILCGTLAVVFYQQSTERQELLEKLQKKQNRRNGPGQAGEPSDGDASTRGSEQVYKQVNLLAQKDAVINELRQRLIALHEGRVPETRLSSNTLPKSVRSSRPKMPPERPPETPRTNIAAPAQPVPAPVFKSFADQESSLGGIDVSSMPAGEQENHNELLRRLETRRRIVDELNRNRGTDSTAGLRAKLAREEQAVKALMRQERLALFSNMGRELGYDDESSLSFAEYIERVDAMTTFESSVQTAPSSRSLRPEMPTRAVPDDTLPAPPAPDL